MEKKLVRGRSIQGLVAACLYASCRNTETPRTLDDVAKGINIRRKDVARCYRLIFRELELKMPVVDPVKGVSRIASIAELSEKSKRKAISILNEAKKMGMVLQEKIQWELQPQHYILLVSVQEKLNHRKISQLHQE